MILPVDVLPKYSLYYIGGLILKEMSAKEKYEVSKLFDKMKVNHDISYKLFILSIDWLFVIGAVKSVQEGEINYVYKKIID